MSLPRQLRCVWSAFFIFISGGVKISQNAMKLQKIHEAFHSAWFYLAIVGALLALLFSACIPYKYSYMISSGLVIFGGIYSITSISTSDCLDGTAFGMTIVAMIAAAGENLKARYRGRVLSVEVLGVSIGMVIYCIVFLLHSQEGNLMWFRIFGYISIGCGLCAFITSFYANNSPIHYIQNKSPQRAIHAIQKVYYEKHNHNPSIKVMKQFSELDKYVNDMSNFSRHELGYDLLAFLKIAVIRVLLAVITSFCFILCFEDYYKNDWDFVIVLFGFSRILGSLAFIILIDWIGRKIVSMASLGCIGVLLIALGLFYHRKDAQIALMFFPVIGQFLTGLGAGVSTVYMSEAFSLRSKTLLICLLVGLENASIIFLNEFVGIWKNDVICLGLGTLCLTVMGLVFVFLPETNRTSFTEARIKFNKVISIKS